MCLAIPVKIIEKKDNSIAVVELDGVNREVSLELLESAEVGDYVLLHAGFAIQKVNEHEAKETLKLLQEIELI